MNARRNFIKTTAAAGIGVAFTHNANSSVFSAGEPKRPIHIFTKCLQFLTYTEMASVLANHGFDGADLTVRDGGQVLPGNVASDLPKAVKALRDAGVDSKMIVTQINNAEDPDSEQIIKTMAALGIKYYRMGYIKYDDRKTIPQNLADVKFTFENLEKLNRKYGVSGNYQNHSGTGLGGPVWDLYEVLKDLDPEYIGVQYDIRHATVEGGISWPLGMKLLAPWIQTIDIKDFIWNKNANGQWDVKNVPLGEGMVDFEQYFELYKSLQIEAPVSIHYEYDLGGAEHGKKNPTMSHQEIFSCLKKDIAFIKNEFDKYNL